MISWQREHFQSIVFTEKKNIQTCALFSVKVDFSFVRIFCIVFILFCDLFFIGGVQTEETGNNIKQKKTKKTKKAKKSNENEKKI